MGNRFRAIVVRTRPIEGQRGSPMALLYAPGVLDRAPVASTNPSGTVR